MFDSRMHWKKADSRKSNDNTGKLKKRPLHKTIEVPQPIVRLKQLSNERCSLHLIIVQMHLCT